MHNQSDLKVNYHSRTFFSHSIRSALLKYVSFAKFLTRERCLWWPSLEAATPPGHPDFRASGILSDGALGRRCYLLIPGDLNSVLQLCFRTHSRSRRTAIIFRQLGSADYDLGRRPAPSRENQSSCFPSLSGSCTLTSFRKRRWRTQLRSFKWIIRSH